MFCFVFLDTLILFQISANEAQTLICESFKEGNCGWKTYTAYANITEGLGEYVYSNNTAPVLLQNG